MKEQCSCGAGIVTIHYGRIRDWRQSHRCNPATMLTVLEAEIEDALQSAMFFGDDEEEE